MPHVVSLLLTQSCTTRRLLMNECSNSKRGSSAGTFDDKGNIDVYWYIYVIGLTN